MDKAEEEDAIGVLGSIVTIVEWCKVMQQLMLPSAAVLAAVGLGSDNRLSSMMLDQL